ncbi:phosphomannomutase [Legionella hackeliae]|nr:phosphomannomutase [Legionella hackeliae]
MEGVEVIKTSSMDIFRDYDIRGVIGKYLNKNTYYTLGLVIGSELRELFSTKLYYCLSRQSRK